MTDLAVKIAYIGEGFHGSQRQPGLRTVESEILRNLVTVYGTDDIEFSLKLASRTDRGVNALGNVAVFDAGDRDPDGLLKALNGISRGVFYRSHAYVPEDFKPRYAHRRYYRYIMPAEGVDIKRAKKCASLFLGEHDFSRFCKYDGKPTMNNIVSSDIRIEEDFLIYDCGARFFLWQQVRRMASAIAEVGLNRADYDDVTRALNGEDIHLGTLRGDGLTLMDVEYMNVEFTKPVKTMYERKTGEESYRNKVRSLFFASL
ncbi:MAG: tRNA pseudouridine synthase A [Candidatus Methanomethylophilaceae archaeon]|jgi:tRNA pseudouridine38-40 synthase